MKEELRCMAWPHLNEIRFLYSASIWSASMPEISNRRSFKTDIREEDDKFIMEAELPGFEKGEIQLDVNGDTLTLSAVHQQEQVDKSKEHYICRERSYGSYQRRFDISGIDADQIEAEYKNGILYMILPKKQPKVPANRRLEIR